MDRRYRREDISKLLSIGEPFVYIDEVMVQASYRAKGHVMFDAERDGLTKYFTKGDVFVPESVQVQAMQEMFYMAFVTMPEYEGKEAMLVMADRFRLQRDIRPGEMVSMESRILSARKGRLRGMVESFVDRQRAAFIEFTVEVMEA